MLSTMTQAALKRAPEKAQVAHVGPTGECTIIGFFQGGEAMRRFIRIATFLIN